MMDTKPVVSVEKIHILDGEEDVQPHTILT